VDAGGHCVPADQTVGDGMVLHQRVGFAVIAARRLLGDADDPGFECEHIESRWTPPAAHFFGSTIGDVSEVQRIRANPGVDDRTTHCNGGAMALLGAPHQRR